MRRLNELSNEAPWYRVSVASGVLGFLSDEDEWLRHGLTRFVARCQPDFTGTLKIVNYSDHQKIILEKGQTL